MSCPDWMINSSQMNLFFVFFVASWHFHRIFLWWWKVAMRLHNSNIWIRPTAYVKNKRLLIISLHFWIRPLKLISGIRCMLSIYIEYNSTIMSSYGSWIYNYRCNQYLSQHYMIKFVSDLLQVGGFLRILQFPPPIKQTATI
jgi:hypothetical protein